MGSPDMTSVSVSFEVRRQLNSMRALGNYKSVDHLLLELLKQHRLQQLQGESDNLQKLISDLEAGDVDTLISKLQLSDY